MAMFTDRNGEKWEVALDAPLIEEIEEKHSIDLVDLDNDPLIKLRNHPRKLVSVMYLICQEQIEQKGIDATQFGKVLPAPPDPMFDALREAIVGFFPSGRASHVREVLTKYDEMNTKTDEMRLAQMQEVLDNPKTAQRLKRSVDIKREQLLNEMFPIDSDHGT